MLQHTSGLSTRSTCYVWQHACEKWQALRWVSHPKASTGHPPLLLQHLSAAAARWHGCCSCPGVTAWQQARGWPCWQTAGHARRGRPLPPASARHRLLSTASSAAAALPTRCFFASHLHLDRQMPRPRQTRRGHASAAAASPPPLPARPPALPPDRHRCRC